MRNVVKIPHPEVRAGRRGERGNFWIGRKVSLWKILRWSARFPQLLLYRKCGKATEWISESGTGQFVKGTATMVGMSYFGRTWGEPGLIKLAFAFERAAKVRKAPQFPPGVEVSRWLCLDRKWEVSLRLRAAAARHGQLLTHIDLVCIAEERVGPRYTRPECTTAERRLRDFPQRVALANADFQRCSRN